MSYSQCLQVLLSLALTGCLATGPVLGNPRRNSQEVKAQDVKGAHALAAPIEAGFSYPGPPEPVYGYGPLGYAAHASMGLSYVY